MHYKLTNDRNMIAQFQTGGIHNGYIDQGDTCVSFAVGQQTTSNYADSQCFGEAYHHADILVGMIISLLNIH